MQYVGTRGECVRWENNNCQKEQTPKVGKGTGDPHFVTWSNTKYDFHGACDLVFVQSENFGHGLGLDINIRTKHKTWWSYISAVVVQIGSDTIEVAGGPKSGDKPNYWINGIQKGSGTTEEGKGNSNYDLEEHLSGYKIHYSKVSSKQSKFRIILGNGESIMIETFNEILTVAVRAKTMENFGDAVGLMGRYPSGEMLARDNSTILVDPIEFGKQWQVLESEPMLFHEVGEGDVEHPKECAMPLTSAKESRNLRRRLGETMLTQEDAEMACAHVDENNDHEACVSDVLAMNDVDIAHSYGGW